MLPLEYRLKLNFEDAGFFEFVGISPNQSELLRELSKEWVAEKNGFQVIVCRIKFCDAHLRSMSRDSEVC